MRVISTLILLTLAASGVHAEDGRSAAQEEWLLPLPPPPGPYVSSMPQLGPALPPQQRMGEGAASGNDFAPPYYAGRGISAPTQMPAGPQWWQGPVRR